MLCPIFKSKIINERATIISFSICLRSEVQSHIYLTMVNLVGAAREGTRMLATVTGLEATTERLETGEREDGG